MAAPRGILKIYAKQPGTVAEAIDTLRSIENAYLVLYATELHVETIRETFSGKRRFRLNYPFPLPYLPFTPGLTAHPELMTPDVIRRSILLPEDVLQLRTIQFQSPGFWEVLGSLNPLDQLRKYLQDRHDRKKDTDYRNDEEKRRMDIENAIRETELFKQRVSALRQAGYTDEEIRRLMLPAAYALNEVGIQQDRGLLAHAEIKRFEDKTEQ